MFRKQSNQPASGSESKVLSPTLRPDIYTLVDGTKAWLTSGSITGATSQPGDGVSYKTLLTPIQKHFPETKGPSLGVFGQAEGEIAVIVGGVTNMILELSKWEGMSAGMAMRTWVDALADAHARAVGRKGAGCGGPPIAKGISQGLSQFTDAALLTKDFTTRIQIISCLKTGEKTQGSFFLFLCFSGLGPNTLCAPWSSSRVTDGDGAEMKNQRWHPINIGLR